MENKIINGSAIAEKLQAELKNSLIILKEQHNIIPCLRVILVGESGPSQIYVKNKEKKAKDLGIDAATIKLPSHISEQELINEITNLNNSNNINGILVQLPLPEHINSNKIINLIDPQKDVDCFNLTNVGRLSVDKNSPLKPCTPAGCLYLLKAVLGEDLSGLDAVIIGRSNIVGRPMMQLLLHENCTVTITHSKTKNITAKTKQADILIAALGRPQFITEEWVKEGVTIIDVGINRIENNIKHEAIGAQNKKIVGDVDFNSVVRKAKYITPVPKGVGPMTITFLLKNTIIATCLQKNIVL